MSGKIIVWIVFLTLITLTFGSKETCPPEEDFFEGCVCDWMKGVTCNDIMSPQSLHAIMNVLDGYAVSSFKLIGAFLMYLPKGMFRKIPIKSLEVQNSEILGWETEDGSKMFEGIEDSLEKINMYQVTGLTSWRWSVFSTLKNLKYFMVRRAEVGQIGEDFALVAPTKLKQLYLDYANIKSIHKEAFVKHEELEKISLSGNDITEIKRSMFPNPAKKLTDIELTDNKLKTLPDDIFTEMPELLRVVLLNNKIQRLSEDTIYPLSRRQWLVNLIDNDLYCCSDMKWVVKKDFQKHIIGTCQHPHALMNKKIAELTEIDFSHGLC
ncbi:leucine-rich repeat-containing protein 15-like [Centruroides vittatus]|uniref:leucine-rich repeat-containing protein 15-like n=1 Tax=Centruroides vittatus TaxID=120091 RepID=UPI00350EE6BA